MSTATAQAAILSERAEIERMISGRTLCELLEDNARRHPDAPAASWRQGEQWSTLTWRQLHARIVAAANGLVSLGIGRGDVVALMMTNRPEHLIADQAAVYIGAIPTTLYATLAPEQVRQAAAHCAARVAIVDDRTVAARWLEVSRDLPALQHLVLVSGIEPAGSVVPPPTLALIDWDELLHPADGAGEHTTAAVASLRSQIAPEDPIALLYTSGTTGPPRAVVLTHHNELYECAALDRHSGLPDGLPVVSYLPLAHIAERLSSFYYCLLWKHGHVYFCPDLTAVPAYVKHVRPVSFGGVPRVWEKLWSALDARLDAAAARRRALAATAVACGREVVTRRQKGEPLPLRLRVRHAVLDRLVLAKVRAGLGLDQARTLTSGAAPLAAEVAESFAAIGLPILEAYGMTETSGIATINRPGALRIGTVGPPVAGMELRIAEDGEVLLRGPINTVGYYRDPNATAELLDPDGWLHTGDVGVLDEAGHLSIVDRKKELIITAGGKNVSPATIENLLKEHPLIGQALAVGDRRPYVVALVVLDPEAAPAWARRQKMIDTSLPALAGDSLVRAQIQQAVDAVNQRLSRPEQVKRFAILPAEWTTESGELTPTMKLKRRVIHARYAADIDSLYSEEPRGTHDTA